MIYQKDSNEKVEEQQLINSNLDLCRYYITACDFFFIYKQVLWDKRMR